MESSIKPVYRMSSVGNCARALSAERLGYPFEAAPDWLERAATEGKRHEQWMKEDLRKEGYIIEGQYVCPICLNGFNEQREGIHVELNYPKFNLIGHLDARLHKNGSIKGCELKSRSQYEFDRWMATKWTNFPSAEAQITCYMTADPHEEWIYWVKNRSNGYIDKMVLTQTPIPIQAIIDKLELTERAVAEDKLVDSNYNPNDIECRRCRYKQYCLPKPLSFSEKLTEEILTSACEKWRSGSRMIDEGEQLVKEAKEIFQIQTEAIGQKKWQYNELSITRIDIKEQHNYAKEKLLQMFSEKQLEPALTIKLPYSYPRIDDLRKEN